MVAAGPSTSASAATRRSAAGAGAGAASLAPASSSASGSGSKPSTSAGGGASSSSPSHAHGHGHGHGHGQRAHKRSKGEASASGSSSNASSGAASKAPGAGRTKALFALLGDNAPSLLVAPTAPAASSEKGKARARAEGGAGLEKRSRWTQRRFRNPARSDGLVLTHWVRVDDDDAAAPKAGDGKSGADADADMADASDAQAASTSKRKLEDEIEEDYEFAKFSVGAGVYSYTSDEYTLHLRDDDWSKEETDYLVDMCHDYDLRFTVIADRYDWAANRDRYMPAPAAAGGVGGAPAGAPAAKARSIEDLKARYYALCRRLIRSRISTEDVESRQALLQTYAFDRAREAERKRAVAKLYARTPAQLAEEEALYVEARRIEQNEARFAGQREELLRLLGGWESLQSATPASIAAAGAGLGIPLPGSAAEAEEIKRKKRKAEEAAAAAAAGEATGSASAAATTTLRGAAGAAAAAALSSKQKAELKQAAFDEQHYIQRFDPSAPVSSKPPYAFLTGVPSTHPPIVAASSGAPAGGGGASHGAYVRSTRLLVPRATLAQRAHDALMAMRPPMGHRLVFPNARHCEKWEGLLGAVTAGIEMQRQLDKVEAELAALQRKDEPSAAQNAPAPSVPAAGTPAASTAPGEGVAPVDPLAAPPAAQSGTTA